MFSQYLLRRMRSSRHRKAVILTSLCVLLLMYMVMTSNEKGHSLVKYKLPPSCKHSYENIEKITRLTELVHVILEDFEITHFLMYGSLIDALKYGRLVRWNDTVEFGVLGEELDSIDYLALSRRLRKENVYIADWRFRSGYLRLFSTTHRGVERGVSVKLYVFYDYSGIRKRSGHETWWLYFHYEIHHAFPDRLVQSPLPSITFCDIEEVNVPKQGNEMLRYLFRSDWWKEPDLKDC